MGHQCGFNIASSHSTVEDTGHQCVFNITCRHRTVEWCYEALSSPAVIARWTCTTGHQRGFDIASSHHTVERYYGAPTRLRHCPPSLHCGAVLVGTNAASHERVGVSVSEDVAEDHPRMPS